MNNEFNVAIFGFNRPDCLRQVFDRVREVKPRKVFLVLDAPRKDRVDDLPKWEACKKIFEGIDWECEVFRNYAAENMGCRKRVASGITWVFEHVEEAIILEDDCVPHPDFFRFCDELLERYRFDTRVGLIAGMLEHPDVARKETSYYFDRFPSIWGWATWRRAWAQYEKALPLWPTLRTTPLLYTIFGRKERVQRVSKWFDDAYSGRSNSWATVWWLTCITEQFLCIHPAVNLITNVGYEGAHNAGKAEVHDVPSCGIAFPLKHPNIMVPDFDEEQIMLRRYAAMGLLDRIVAKLLRMMRKKSR